jgi:signal transduction histidine kinase
VRARLLVGYLTVTIFTLAVLVYPLGRTFASRERDRLLRDIEHDGLVVASLSEDALERGEHPDVDALLASYARDPGGRIVIVDHAGVSVADSDTPGQAGVDFTNRPEIVTAINGSRAEGSRHSDTLGADLVYVAVPVASSGIVHGAVRVTYPSSTLDARVRTVWERLLALSGVVIVLVAGLGFLLARSVTRPVDRLARTARRVAAGELSARAPTDRGAPELRELSAVFNDTAARLAEMLASQEAFVADASHQMRTPLAALRLQLENLESRAPVDLQPALAALRAETARLSRISEGLLALTRTAGGAARVEATDVASVAAERQRIWEPVAHESRVTLELAAPPHAWALAVAGALEQILDNLVANALEVAPAGSTVRITVGVTHGVVELHVLDEGSGLAVDDRERAFDRFWRGPGAPPGGTGLGLAIVAQLASRSGGTAELRPGPDGGIDAVVRLPLDGTRPSRRRPDAAVPATFTSP